jgi:hypothetical protein
MVQCGGGFAHQASPAGSGNLLTNGSFENGAVPWVSLTTEHWEAFTVTDGHAMDGRHSAQLVLRGKVSAEGTKIVGAVQEVSPATFPRRLSGFYRIERWTRGTVKQYLQVVVIVFGNLASRPFPNYQIRYVLAGINTRPLQIVNARYVHLGGSDLQEKKWVRFDMDLHADFQREWGRVPTEFSKIRILLEFRYDEKDSGGSEVIADVYYDKLHLGE